MDYALFELVAIGLVVVMAGALLLLSMVHSELGPALRLTLSRRWLLAAALGSGILAFVVKLLLIIAVVSFSRFAPKPLPDPGIAADKPPQEPANETAARYVWTALPQRNRTSEAGLTPASGSYVWQALPEQPPSPPGNPTTPAKVALGERLFFDPLLSRNGTVSCASCHDVYGQAGADGRPVAIGIGRKSGTRNAPTVWNAAFQSVLFWDGRAASLEEQAKGPLINPLEMGMPSPQAVEERVRQEVHYRKAFADAFGAGAPITIDRIAEAIAAYERTLITPDTPYDRFVHGDHAALTAAQLRGMALFQSMRCINCHYGPNFSAASVFGNEMPLRIFPANPTPFEQRYGLLADSGAAAGSGRGVWRVPSLRNVALTGPWLHNGAVTELEKVVRIMAAAQLGRRGHFLRWWEREGTLQEIGQSAPTEQEVADLVAFLRALSSDRLVARMAAEIRHGGDNFSVRH